MADRWLIKYSYSNPRTYLEGSAEFKSLCGLLDYLMALDEDDNLYFDIYKSSTTEDGNGEEIAKLTEKVGYWENGEYHGKWR